MTESIALGPLLLSTTMLVLFSALAAGWWTGKAFNRERDKAIAAFIARTFIVMIVAARASYVVEWFDAYLAHPLDILDVRDGGWNLPIGVLFGWLFAIAARPRAPESSGRMRNPALPALAVTLLAFVAGNAALQALSNGDRRLSLSALHVSEVNGTPTTLARFAARPTVINLWATWCGPCRREMPLLASAQASQRDVDFVFVNQGETADDIRRFLAEEHIAINHLMIDTESQVARAIDLRGWPTTIYLDAQGHVVATDVGGLTPAKLDQRLSELRVH